MASLTKTLFAMACCWVFGANAAPTTLPNTGVIEYLEQFGYLTPRSPYFAQSRTKESLAKAISAFQSFMGINVTGIADEETNRLIKSPRCGLTDEPASANARRSKRYAILGDRWRKETITYRVSKYSYKLDSGAVDQVIADAFAMWAEHVPLKFRPMSHGQADIDIRFERGWHSADSDPFDGPGRVLAHAFAPGPGIQGDVHFDDDEKWTIGGGYGTDFFQIAVHEIGHALGLGHSNARASIMYPTYRYNFAVKLDRDDIAGIEALYRGTSRGNNVPVIRGYPWINEIVPRQWLHPRFSGWLQPVRI